MSVLNFGGKIVLKHIPNVVELVESGQKRQTLRLFKYDLHSGTQEEAMQDKDTWRIVEGTPLQLYTGMRQKKVYEEQCPNFCDYRKWKPVYKPRRKCPSCGSKTDWRQISGCRKLRDAVVTETFLVKMGKDELGYYIVEVFGDKLGSAYNPQSIEDLAKQDFFKNAEDMFNCIDELYDLSEPKILQAIIW